jgi:hypothetical protein
VLPFATDRGDPVEGRARVVGYSGTPLARKLGIKPGARLALLGAPEGFAATLDLATVVGEVRVLHAARAPIDVAVLFAPRRAGLDRRFAAAAEALTPAGGLWVAWPKRASGVATDLTDAEVREIGLAAGLVDNKVCAIDAVWSGLRFVRRVRDR